MSRHATKLPALPALLAAALLAAGCGGRNSPATTPATSPTPAGGDPSRGPQGSGDNIRRIFAQVNGKEYDFSNRNGVSWTPQELPDDLGPQAFNLDIRFYSPDGPLQERDFLTVTTRADGDSTQTYGHIRLQFCRYETFTVTVTTRPSSTYAGQRLRLSFTVGGNENGVDATAPRPHWCGYKPEKKERLHEVAVHFPDYYRQFDDLNTRTGISWTPKELPTNLAGPFVLNIQFLGTWPGPREFRTVTTRADGTTTIGTGHIRPEFCDYERFEVTAATPGDDTYAEKTTRLVFTVGGNENGVDATAPRPNWCGGEPEPPEPEPTTPGPVGVPGGLKVVAIGTDFIEFGWDAVEGATGYEIQMSLEEDDFRSVTSATMRTTAHRFPVAPETTGYARVRAFAGERRSNWSRTATGTSMAAPLVLDTPEPRVSTAFHSYIEWSWRRVENAIGYQVRVADSLDGLADAATQITTDTRFGLHVGPESEWFLQVRAAAGTLSAPVMSDWSDVVMGESGPAPPPFAVSMSPPNAADDRRCSGQAFCEDAKPDSDPTATAQPNQEMTVTVSSHFPATVWPRWIESEPSPSNPDGGPAIRASLSPGESHPLRYVLWPILRSKLENEGAVFVFFELDSDGDPHGDPLYITCGLLRCSAAASSPPARPR